MKNMVKKLAFPAAYLCCFSAYADALTGLPKNQMPVSPVGDTVHIAKVNMVEVMWSTDEGQALKISLENMQKEKNNELEKKSQELAQAVNDYRTKATTLNDNAREREEKKLAKMQRDLQQADTEAKEELESHAQKATMQMAQRVDKKIADVAKRKKCDLVQCEATQKVWTISATTNLTEAVRDELNNEHRQLLAQNVPKISSPSKDDARPAASPLTSAAAAA